MGTCLSDHDLAAFVEASATPEQLSTWNEHLDTCDSCALRLARRHVSPTGSRDNAYSKHRGQDEGPDQDATFAFEPPSHPEIDAGGALPPANAIPGYRILKELHRGGQGVVYQAVQLNTKRKVALKVMLEGPFAGSDSKRRFEREIALVGSLRHPNIIPIFDSGVAQGRFYYAMEYIRGEPLSQYVQHHKLSVDDTLRLFKKVCDAMDYAHQKGVIHRDLKPSNILVDDRGDPYVLDFGLAKIGGAEADDESQAAMISVTGQVMGTLPYMSPEQARGRPDQVDMRSDVYALGVILYELLTGQYPYEVVGEMGDVLRNIKETEPRRPSTIRRQVGDEIETIVLKALSKAKDRRYYAAGPLGEDVERFLAGEPIEAKRDSALYLLKRTLRRYKVAAVVVVGVAMLVAASTVALSVMYRKQGRLLVEVTQAKNEAQANQQKAVAAEARVQEALDLAEQDRDTAVQSARELRKQIYVSDMSLAHRAVEDGNLGRARTLLSKHQANPDEEDLRGIEWRHLWSRSQGNFEADLGPYVGYLSGLTISPDGQFVALNRRHPTRVEVIPLASGSVAKSIAMQDTVIPLAYSPSGNFLIGHMRGKIIGWDTRNWKALEAAPLTFPFAFGVHGDQEILVAREGDHLSMWNVTTGQTLGALENKEPEAPLLDPSYGLWWHMINVVAVSSDSDVVYLAGARKIRRWDLHQRTELPPFEIAGMACLATSGDGQLAGADAIGNVLLIQPQSGEILHTFKPHKAWTTCLKFTRDGTRLVSASIDRNLVIYDPINRSMVGRLLGHQGEVVAMDISADGQTVVSGASRVLRWSPTESGNESFDLGVIKTSSVLEDGRILMLRDNAKDLEYYDPVSGAVEPAHAERLVRAMREIQSEPIAFSPTARWAVSIDGSKLAVWNVSTGELERSLGHPSGSIGGAIFSPDGSFLVTGSEDSEVRLWQTRDWTSRPLGQRVHTHLNWGAFSRDKRRVAITGHGERIRVYDFEEEPREIVGAKNLTGYSVALSGNGRWLAGGGGSSIVLLDLDSNEIRATLKGHLQGVFSLSFSPDDRTLVSSSGSRVIFWNVETSQELMRFHDSVPPRTVFMPRVEFSPGGRYLARTGTPIGEMGARFRIWQAPGFEEIAEKHKR